MPDLSHIVFDLGGVVLVLDKQQALRRFLEIGFSDAPQYLDAYTQQGIFGELESGAISAEQFRQRLSRLAGRDFTHQQCAYAWQGYCAALPQRNLDTLQRLRQQGYRVCLLSNTNPYMMQWARSTDFDGHGNPIDHYFDALYLSYEMRLMKPDRRIFEQMLAAEEVQPEQVLFVDDGPQNVAAAAELGIRTFQPVNGQDWTNDILLHLQ